MSRIILKKLIIQGISYRRTIEFNDGLTIISGEKTSGKSLILSLIDYCLGKGSKIDLTVQKELDAYCDQVYLETLINNDIITFNRALKKNFDKIKLYFCPFVKIDEFTPKIVYIKEAMNIIMEKLSVNEYKLIRHKQHSTEKEIDVVSFRDIFRYVYIHQHDLGTDNFLENNSTFKANKNPHAFKMMFNLIEVDKDTLNEKLVEIQNKISEEKREIVGLKSYLRDRDAEDPLKLQLKIEKVEKEIENRKIEKGDVVQNSRSNENKENQLYIKLKRDIENISNEVFNFRKEEKLLNLSVSSKMLLLEEYDVELVEIEETLNINYKLVIADQIIECPLCNSQIKHNHTSGVLNSGETEKILQKIRKEIESKKTLVSGLIETENKKVEELNNEISNLNQKREIFDEAIKVFSKKTEVPFLSQIETLNSMINRLTRDQEILKESMRIYHKIEEKEASIISLGIKEEKLKLKLAALQVKGAEKEKIINFLDLEYRQFMIRLKYEFLEDTYINRENFIPYYNGASVYAHESGGLLESMQLSYLGAILNSKEAGYAVGHPGFLMLDSISKYVGTLKKENQDLNNTEASVKNQVRDPEVYEEFYKILVELGDHHQIILVENTPPTQFDKLYTKYTFYNGEHGLIDEEANEIKE
ncbi:AAA family ATPase [Paenibacillus sp. FSL H7-0690]|uniref:AAA family ATPase n=1 Tax=Paenibacillus sp. FSL H7-0690 TaxID=2921437 RepID=UPI0030EF14DB